MSDKMVLKAEIRQSTGTSKTVRLRKAGKMPAIIYGHKKAPVSVALDAHKFVRAIHHGQRIFEVDLDGTTETLLIKDAQYDHLGRNMIHVDLVRVDLQEKVTVAVPLELKGTSAGSHEGAIIDEHLDHLEIECTVASIPEKIVFSIKEVHVGDSVHARDVELPAGMVLKTSTDALILTCHLVAAAISAEDETIHEGEEAPTSPEVITEKAGEETTD
ncbi:MAG: 50S ribosomal protein L25 [Planctomycetes bacterium]|nr:50S ribosomal protein L25 [Planctomycetota bacterium]